MPMVIIQTKNVSREEVEELNNYLENNSWDTWSLKDGQTYAGGGEIEYSLEWEDDEGDTYTESFDTLEKLIELNERLSGIYAELYSIKKDMETFYEDEITHNEKVGESCSAGLNS
jgi:hypothetical protein